MEGEQSNPHSPGAVRPALEGLADGVHVAEPALCVSPGGWIEGYLFANKNPYVKAVAPLFNAGKLHAIGIHRYWDVDYVPMEGKYRFSLQSQFDEVKRNAGITADVKFYTDEVNFKKRKISEEEAAKGLLTALWDTLGVVGNQGQPVSELVLPWNLFHLTTRDEEYGMCTQLDPWSPTARGRVVQMVCQVTAGLELVSADPKGKGEFVLEGKGKKLWVWQNRKAWTNHPGTSFTPTAMPPNARTLEVYAWDGLKRHAADYRPVGPDRGAGGRADLYVPGPAGQVGSRRRFPAARPIGRRARALNRVLVADNFARADGGSCQERSGCAVARWSTDRNFCHFDSPPSFGADPFSPKRSARAQYRVGDRTVRAGPISRSVVGPVSRRTGAIRTGWTA